MKRRAISTVIGSVFFMVLMTAGMSVSYLVIEAQSDMISAQQTISDAEIKKIQEKFYAVASVGANNKLVVYVQNQGSNSLVIDTLWLINKTGMSQAVKYDLNYADSVLAPGYGGDVAENQQIFLNPGEYDVKLVSSLGTIKTAERLNVGGSNSLKAKLILNPPDVRLGENATALLYVTNVGNTKMVNVTSGPITVSPPTAVLASSPIVQIKSDLLPAESAILSWKYRLMGPAGTNVTFSTFAQGIEEPTGITKQSNTDQGIVLLRDNSEPGSIVSSDLFSRPEIYMVIPNTFGDASDKGVWGVNIVNPTDQPIYVSKVVISVQTSPANANDKIFDSGCSTITIPPTSNHWSCPTLNQLMWKNTISPQLIPAKSVFPFMVKVTPGDLQGSGTEPETIVVQTNVFTTLGQFGKSAYGTAMRTSSSIPNVYLSKVVDSTNTVDIIANKTGILPGSTQTFHVVLADMESGITNKISAGSRLIINIPRGWSDVNVIGNTGFTTPTFQSFPDGSSQLVGQLLSDLTGAGGVGKTISFTATAPPISDTRLYIMYVLADGYVNGNIVIGPLAEVVLRVSPN
ncbi:MAG: hypothetical protein QXE84_01325 [Candidatus Nitrosotenuis sp.]|uniref:Uncharacterized protein n=1 Tax=Candidatus Nitrosotenuis uzonensis TaxID=1407055 RepID=A0A812F2U6_9ARCH|nr:hypothetical protein [Candidatus Nitrosotenuis uzonensis]MCA2003934.1 hypothetical protein [Candidatus Nitrosotenuis sp.]CAE6498534.1 conserved hypothetical protein [Candidatus Nitrosotenuis uzonensis]